MRSFAELSKVVTLLSFFIVVYGIMGIEILGSGVLQCCVAVGRSRWQWVTVGYSGLQWVARCCCAWRFLAQVCCSVVLQCAAVCCSLLQLVVVCCKVLLCIEILGSGVLQCCFQNIAVCCSVM